MLKRLTRYLAPLAVAVTLALGAGVVAHPGHAAYALGPGHVCVFLAPNGAFGLGHVGWAYQVAGTPTYVFGSTEGRGAAAHIPAGQPNGYWSATGTYSAMLATFRVKNGGYYTEYKCESTGGSAVGAANAAAAAPARAGYDVIGNNCVDHTIRILGAYGAPALTPAWQYPAPFEWFNELRSSGPGGWSVVQYL